MIEIYLEANHAISAEGLEEGNRVCSMDNGFCGCPTAQKLVVPPKLIFYY